MRSEAPLMLLILLLVGAAAPVVRNGVLPATLREDAQRRGCSEIADFYDRPGRIDPAYVFGYLDSKLDQFGDNSAIYWCQRPPAAERYLLVVWLSDSTVANAFNATTAANGSAVTLNVNKPPDTGLFTFIFKLTNAASGEVDTEHIVIQVTK